MDTEQTNLGIERALGVLRRRVGWICFASCWSPLRPTAIQSTRRRSTRRRLRLSSTPTRSASRSLDSQASSGGSSSMLAQQASNIEHVKLGDMAAKTASLLGHGLTEEEVSESVSIAARGETNVVDISATATSPVLAAEIANTYTSQFVKEQQALTVSSSSLRWRS